MELNEEMIQKVKEYLANGENVDAVCEKLGLDKEMVNQVLNNVSAEDLNKAASMLGGFKLGE